MEERIKCIFCDSDAAPTDEHVIPEFAGGTLIIRNVCKTCNDKMGSDFEGPISHFSLFRLPRNLYGIQGKSSTPIAPFPFSGTTEDGRKVMLDDGIKPRFITRIKEEECAIGEIKLSLHFDVSEKDKIPKILEKKIRRTARKHWPDLTKNEVDALVAQAINAIPADPIVTSEQPTIKYSESIDLNALKLLFMKVAFEIAVHHHGPQVLSDHQTLSLRKGINNRDAKAKMALPSSDLFSFVPFPENSHAVLLCENVCYIRLFNMSAIVQVVSDKSRYTLQEDDWVVYWFNYVEGKDTKEPFLRYVADRGIS
jgi:hypothetical protein